MTSKRHGFRISKFGDLFDQLMSSDGNPDKYAPGEMDRIRSLAKRYQESSHFDRLANLARDYHGYAPESPEQRIVRIVGTSPSRVRFLLHQLYPSARMLHVDPQTIWFEAPPLYHVPMLPKAYGYKGGAARLALAGVLGESVRRRRPRDLDLVRVGQDEIIQDGVLAQEYMPEDFKFGASTEVVATLEEYLATRDVVLNEVLLIDRRVVCSLAALEDAINLRLRPTAHVLDDNGYPQGRVVMKLIRMLAEGRVEGKHFELFGIPADQKIEFFDIALHLDRAFEHSVGAAEVYLSECVRLGMIELDPEKDIIDAAIDHLGSALKAGVKFFKNLSGERKSGAPSPPKPGRIGKSPVLASARTKR